jgi:Holliday junction resolvase RusA-like endonuclease
LFAFAKKGAKLTVMPPSLLSRRRAPVPRPNRFFVARDDPMIIITNTTTTLSLSVLGEPVSQPRSRARRSDVRMWNPADKKKRAFKAMLREALADVGATPFPLFKNGMKLKVMATFHVFNTRKDVDNLVKFLLDAMEDIVYKNDNWVYSVVAKKIRTTRNREFTEFEVESMVE